MYAFLKSWKTSLSAIGLLLSAGVAAVWAIIDGDPETHPDLNTVWMALIALFAALQGIFARDADKSSQDSHIRP
jgi:hypothetical protein